MHTGKYGYDYKKFVEARTQTNTCKNKQTKKDPSKHSSKYKAQFICVMTPVKCGTHRHSFVYARKVLCYRLRTSIHLEFFLVSFFFADSKSVFPPPGRVGG